VSDGIRDAIKRDLARDRPDPKTELVELETAAHEVLETAKAGTPAHDFARSVIASIQTYRAADP
jgi:hypothetical protein